MIVIIYRTVGPENSTSSLSIRVISAFQFPQNVAGSSTDGDEFVHLLDIVGNYRWAVAEVVEVVDAREVTVYARAS